MADPLRVLRVSERIPPLPGGKEVHVAELTRHQTAMGDTVHIVYRFGQGNLLSASSVDRVSLPRSFSGALGTAAFAFRTALRYRSTSDFDVIHLHGDFLEVIPMSWLARRRNARLVMTVHGGMNPKYRRLSRRPLRLVDQFIALGQRVADDLTDRGVPRSRIATMSSGLSMDLLDASGVGHTQAGLVVTVGTLDRVKNHELVIRSVMALPPEVHVRLLIVGDGPDRSRLESIARGCPRVEFLGRLDRQDVYRIVAHAQVFVLASKPTLTKSEGIPTALLEAMYLSRHCLVSKGACPAPVVSDTRSYETFDSESDELTGLLLDAIADPAHSAAIGSRARTAVAHLGWPDVTRAMRELLTPSRGDTP